MLESSFRPTETVKKDYTPLPVNIYQFQLISVEMKEVKKFQSEELENGIEFTFACLEEKYYGRRIWRTVNTKLIGGDKPSGLYTVLSGLVGRSLLPKECFGPDAIVDGNFINALVGKQTRLFLGQKVTKKLNTINVIQGYLPLEKELPPFDEEKSKALAEQYQDVITPEIEAKIKSDVPFA